MQITPQDRRRLCAEAGVDDRTVRRAYRGDAMKSTTHDRLTRAARKLKLPEPPPLVLETRRASDATAEAGEGVS